MPEGRAERAVEANAKSIDVPRAQRHAESRDGRRAHRNQNRLPDRWPVRGQEVGHDRDQIQCHDCGLIAPQIAVTRAADLWSTLDATRTNSDTQAVV